MVKKKVIVEQESVSCFKVPINNKHVREFFFIPKGEFIPIWFRYKGIPLDFVTWVSKRNENEKPGANEGSDKRKPGNARIKVKPSCWQHALIKSP